jgi:hypothetical protein
MTTVSFQPTAHDQPYPESPCNVDALIDLPGYGPVVKVTGRGITPREALAKAARLVNHDAVRPTDTPAAYTVDSATDTTRAYAVSDGICACVDYVKRAHRLHAYCVHTLAVDFYARLSESL